MKRFLVYVALAVLLAAPVLPAPGLALARSMGPQTYTVLVGYENVPKGVGIMSFFPGEVTIHTGDTVHWAINTHEIHTVSFGYADGSALPPVLAPAFLFGYPMPPAAPSPLVINPAATIQVPAGGGLFTAHANSGMMSLEPGAVKTFDLTFPDAGDYLYVCQVHGWMMKGMVHVVGPVVPIPSPGQSAAMGNQEIAKGLAQIPEVARHGMAQIQPPVTNSDGTKTFKVMVGYNEGNIDMMWFFPNKLTVRQGDTIVWELSPHNIAPHTVTFLNGAAGPNDFIPFPVGGGVVALYVNPAILAPSQPTPALTREGIYSAGILVPPLPTNPPTPQPTWTLAIGDMTPGLQPYECLLHESSGMLGTLMVVPRNQ